MAGASEDEQRCAAGLRGGLSAHREENVQSAEADSAIMEAGMAKPSGLSSRYFQVGIAVLDTPRLAISTIDALLEMGMQRDQLCLVCVRPVMVVCTKLAASFAGGHQHLIELFGDARRWAAPLGDDEIVATSQPLFLAFLRSQLTEAGSIVRSQASRRSWDVERAIRGGASAIVTHPRDTRQHQMTTRILLANITHNVTTYDLPQSATPARGAFVVSI